MLILHISDLHLKHKHKYSNIVNGIWDRMFEEKMNVLEQVPNVAKKYKVNCICITGDIFDGTNPIEPIKAEFVKWVQKFEKSVFIIPGNHEMVNEDNHALMDLSEAFGKEHIQIKNEMKLWTKEPEHSTGLFHIMMDGIDEHYKNTIKYDDERFNDCRTILLGDYHSFFRRKYGDKLFTYAGAPYPTRMGEDNHSVSIVDTVTHKIIVVKLNSYVMREFTVECVLDVDDSYFENVNTNQIIKVNVKSDNKYYNDVKNKLEILKNTFMEYKQCIDFVYIIKTTEETVLNKTQGKTIHDIAYNFIDENCSYKEEAKSRYKEIMAGEL